MKWLLIISVCLLSGWWLFSMLLGGADEAVEAVKASPARGCAGIVCCAVIVFIGLIILGLLSGR